VTVGAVEAAPAPNCDRARDKPKSDDPPAWLTAVALGLAAGVLTFGLGGLLLAMNGWYHPLPAFVLGLTGWVALVALAKPVYLARGKSSRAAHGVAAVGVFCALVVVGWNATNISQHVLINRDGGSYANTARWIARDGSLEVDIRDSPLANDPSLRFGSYAVYQMPKERLEFQFAHLLPVVLAEAYAMAGDEGLFHAPPVLGGIALLAFFVLLWRVTRRPLPALAGMLALAFIIPQVSFARDTYSELPSQIFVFAALICLVGARYLPGPRAAFVAGCFVGAIEATRVDGLAFLIGVPVLLAGGWIAARSSERRSVGISIAAFVVGLAPGLAIGFLDLVRYSGRYWADLRGSVRHLAMASIGITVMCAVVVALWPFVARRVLPLFRTRAWLWVAAAAAAGVIFVGFAAWLLRPSLQTVIGRTGIPTVGTLQAAEGKPVNAARRYSEYSMQWMAWYLGAVTLAAAIVGAGVAIRSILVGRATRLLAVVCILGPAGSIYLLRPRAVPDHIWVTRRFLVATFPLLILLAMLVVALLLQVRGRARGFAMATAALIALLSVLYPLATVRDVRAMAEQRRFLGVIQDTCDTVGRDAAVVVLPPSYDKWLPQTLRSWCGADVAAMRKPDAAALQRIAARAERAGQTLFVVARRAETIGEVLPDASAVATRRVENNRFLEKTLTHRPDEYDQQGFELAIARVSG
jgi:hypothetical protein